MDKNLDNKGRWRNKTVAFRVSEDEGKLIDKCVALSGLSKQDYIIRRLQCRDVVVQGNPRVYKALRNQMAEIYEELKRGNTGKLDRYSCPQYSAEIAQATAQKNFRRRGNRRSVSCE